MKKAAIIMSVFLSASIFAAESSVIFNDGFTDFKNWLKNPACEKIGGGGSFEIISGEKSGTCLKIVTNDKQVFMLNCKETFSIPKDGKVQFSFLAKGKGAILFIPMGNTKKDRVYLERKEINIDSKDWKKVQFTCVIKDQLGNAFSGETLTLRMNISQNSSLMIDDFTVETVK